jgi:hypothetical protein
MKNISEQLIGASSVVVMYVKLKSGPAFNKVADSKLVAVMRRDLDKAKDFANRTWRTKILCGCRRTNKR